MGNKDFRYIVRNGETDITVLIKRASEGLHLPYRKISLDILGALTPLKTVNKDPEENNDEESETHEEGSSFTSPGRSHRRKNFIPKEQIFLNLTAVLNGFEVTQRNQCRIE